jgi:DNA-binding transcriptional LysR family regulator
VCRRAEKPVLRTAVAEEGQFTRAASRLLVAQPAVSAQIRRLERELGESLFHRDPRSVSLTEAGEALLPHGRLKHEWALLPLRVRGIERVRLHADLTILARLACALARARAVPLAA